MKLYLSSYRVPVEEELFKLLSKKPSHTKVGIISNAGDYYAERARNFKLNEKKEYLKELGFKQISELDLRRYRKEDKLDEDLGQIDLLWVSGGNTFCLREEMEKSGFENLLQKHLDRGLVYAGESAGAVVIGNSLEGIELADEPAFAEKHLSSGLNIIDNYILPHVGSPFFPESIEQARQLHKNNKTLVELTDYQALVINGSDRKIVTAKEV